MAEASTFPHPDLFAAWLPAQRWFGDKSRAIDTVQPVCLASIALGDVNVDLIEVTVGFEGGGESRYFVPLASDPSGGLVDAFSHKAFLAWLGGGFDDRRTIETPKGDGAITWIDAAGEAAWAGEPARVLSGEQSNTSVMFGESAILKAFRRLQEGLNPDSEIVSYLTEEGSFGHAPEYLGAIRLRSTHREDVELAAVQRFIPNDGDCWRWLPGALAMSHAAERGELTESIRLLGQRTAELHVALGRGVSDAFRPEPIGEEDVAELEARLGRELRQTGSMLHRHGACSYDESESLVGALMGDVTHASVLEGSQRIRVHGDYHLGQVLRAQDDFVIIDFEGEPSRSMTERRMKHPALKDVAGMLRSIDYAAASARLNHEGSATESEIRSWRNDAEAAFLDGYLRAIAASTVPLVPPEPGRFQRALDLFMIEKALYEVRYELDNRPDWIDIPLGALKRIAGAGR